VLWTAGAVVAWLTGAPDQAGWLAIRLDLAGILYTAGSLVGGWNFAGAGVRALRTLKLDMNFLMSAAIVGAIVIGEPFEAATLAFLFSLAELLERYAVDRGAGPSPGVALAPEQADGSAGRFRRNRPRSRASTGRSRHPPRRQDPGGRSCRGREPRRNEATIAGSRCRARRGARPSPAP
jgi:hypothetical protein